MKEKIQVRFVVPSKSLVFTSSDGNLRNKILQFHGVINSMRRVIKKYISGNFIKNLLFHMDVAQVTGTGDKIEKADKQYSAVLKGQKTKEEKHIAGHIISSIMASPHL